MKKLILSLLLALATCCVSTLTPVYAQFKPDVKFAQAGDIKLAYYLRGTGKPLLMINGYISTMSLWDPALLAELAKHHTLILFDNRGVGLSSDTKENQTTIPQMADDAANLVKQLGYEKVDVLGWSMGARIAQQFLIRHADLVDKAVLCSANPGGKYEDKATPDIEAQLNNPNTPEIEKISLAFTNNAAGRLAAKESLARIKSAVAAGIVPNDFKVSKETEIRQNRARTTLWKEDNNNYLALKNIKMPVLLADGRYDVIDRPRNSLIIADQIPYAWLTYFNGGHAFLFQDHEAFASVVNTFLE